MEIRYTNLFSKGLKNLKKQGNKKAIKKLEEIVPKLQNKEQLDPQLKDHKLHKNDGIKEGSRCLHLLFDILLVYVYEGDVLSLEQIGDHHTLRGFKEALESTTDDSNSSEVDSEGNALSQEQVRFFKSSKIRDYNNNLLVVYHGTNAEFNTFAKGDVGYHFGTNSQASNRGEIIKSYYLNIKNPLYYGSDLGDWNYKTIKEVMIGDLTENDDAGYVWIIGHQHSEKSFAKYGITLGDLDSLKSIDSNEAMRKFLLSKGIDGIIYYNDWESPADGRYSYIALEPNQIKLVTTTNPTSSNRIDESISRVSHNEYKATMNDGTPFTMWVEWENGYGTVIAYVGDNWIGDDDRVIRKNIIGVLNFEESSKDENYAYIEMVQVRDDMKRKGIGTAMIQVLYDLYKEVNWGYTTDDGTEFRKGLLNKGVIKEGLSREEVLDAMDKVFGQEGVYSWSTFILPNGHFLNPDNPNAIGYWEDIEDEPEYEHSDFIHYEYNPYGEGLFDDCVKINTTYPYIRANKVLTPQQCNSLRSFLDTGEYYCDIGYDELSDYADITLDEWGEIQTPILVDTPVGSKIYDASLGGNEIVKAIQKGFTRGLLESKQDTQKFIDWAGEELANRFFKQKDRMQGQEKDVYYWMGKKKWWLEDRLKDLENTPTNKEQNKLAKEGAEKVYEDDTWSVVHILNYSASKKYGKGTEWCLSGANGDGPMFFDNYKNSDIYFYINKKIDHKWAVLFSKDGSTWTIWDDSDVIVPIIEGAPIVNGKDVSRMNQKLQQEMKSLYGQDVKEIHSVLSSVFSDTDLMDAFIDYPTNEAYAITLEDGTHRYCYREEFVSGNTLVDVTQEVEEFISDYLESLDENINEKLSVSKDEVFKIMEDELGSSETPIDGPSYILPNGHFLKIDSANIDIKGMSGNQSKSGKAMHLDVLGWLEKRFEGKFDSVYDFTEDFITTNCIKVNTNDIEHYVIMPLEKPEEAQFKALLTWLDYLSSKRKNVLVMDFYGSWVNQKEYSFDEYIPDEIIKKIKKYYASGSTAYNRTLEESIDNDIQVLYDKKNLVEQLLKDKYGKDATFEYDMSSLILRDGTIIQCDFHPELINFLCDTGKFTEDEMKVMDSWGAELLPALLGCTRETMDKFENYISLPSERLTYAQYNRLQEWLDDDIQHCKEVTVLTDGARVVRDSNSSYKVYSYSNHTTDDIIKNIKRWYSTGVLVESMQEISESLDKECETVILDKFHKCDDLKKTAMYLMPEGYFLETNGAHRNIENYLDEVGMSQFGEKFRKDDGSPTLERNGAIRINASDPLMYYIKLSNEKPTEAQYDKLLEVFDTGLIWNWTNVAVYTPRGYRVEYDLTYTSSDEVVRKIRQFYRTFILM